ncbi:hypothetical protein LUZ61_007856 [Rhynchospora tenuis]|uniref:Uncharacterized protein n=1 Tax=Rhynchospora tenuis TaxID=198213 RepID=A0AAD5ZUA7_9POAL|nr:hypothetical protein LUZ61_007856 [Rhynchospora tenuis]
MESRRKEERWSLEGKTALVTGGSKGIGRGIVEELAAFGVRVNNVGVGGVKSAIEITTEDYSSCMALNLESNFHLSQLAYPLLKASGRGNVVNISSIAGVGGAPLVAHYASAKGAVIQLTKTLAYEWAKNMIGVNCIAPGQLILL